MKSTLALLSEAGIVAIKAGKFESAKSIFSTIHELTPNNAAGNIGLASIELLKGKTAEAISYLKSSIDSKLDNASEARKMLLVATMLNGDKKAAGELHQTMVDESSCEPSSSRAQEAKAFFSTK